jgi:hypothetical protein
MGSTQLRALAFAAALAGFAAPAHAWYGPTCYTDRTTRVTLTVISMAGENPGDVKVSFDNNEDGIIGLGEVRASREVKNAHEINLNRVASSPSGIVGVYVQSPRLNQPLRFELEFRKDPSECTGAIIRASDHGTAPAIVPAVVATAARPRQPRHPKPRPVPVSAPAATEVEAAGTAPAPEAASPEVVNEAASSTESAKASEPQGSNAPAIVPVSAPVAAEPEKSAQSPSAPSAPAAGSDNAAPANSTPAPIADPEEGNRQDPNPSGP